jgi:DNA-directed RNA polymerase specialized sigma24 family protein
VSANRTETNLIAMLAIREAFRRMSLEQRAIYRLCVVEELSTPKVCAILKVPQKTITAELSKAKQAINQAIYP